MQDHYTKIDNRFIDDVMPTLKGSELACCMAIFRKTAGWGKTSAALSIETISEITGIRRRHTVLDALHALEHKGIIEATKASGKTTVYSFCYYLKQSFKTSDENDTGDGKRTGAENDTGTSDEKRTSASDENDTGPSIYKEKRKKKKEKREGERDFYQLNKKAIDRFISEVIESHEYIRSTSAYRRKMIQKFINEDRASIAELEERIPVYRCEDLEKQYRMEPFSVLIDQDFFVGELLSIGMEEDGKVCVKLRCSDTGNDRGYLFRDFESLENFLKNGGNR